MGMFVYKMFDKGLKCRGYQFKVGVNECEHATCVREGFHAAENPLDCLSYYPNFDESECWLCYADGDIHEDGSDSKISCTRLEILRPLDKFNFVYEAVRYILAHPKRPLNELVCRERGTADSNGFVIVKGRAPVARGNRDGDVLAWLIEDRNGALVEGGASLVDSSELCPGKWYDIFGKECAVSCD